MNENELLKQLLDTAAALRKVVETTGKAAEGFHDDTQEHIESTGKVIDDTGHVYQAHHESADNEAAESENTAEQNANQYGDSDTDKNINWETDADADWEKNDDDEREWDGASRFRKAAEDFFSRFTQNAPFGSNFFDGTPLEDVIGDAVADAAEELERTAESWFPVAKINTEIARTETIIQDKLKSLGEIVYSTHKNGVSASPVALQKNLRELDRLYAKREKLKDRLGAAKRKAEQSGKSEESESDKVYCTRCGAAVKSVDRFCRKCGAKL